MPTHDDKQPPRFTIILPTHNRADVLPFAIRSVLWQTLSDFELYIVGDGCTDNTAGVVAGFDDPRVRWFDLPKAPGVGYANRNTALKESRGAFIAFIGHDDIWLPDHLELLYGCIKEGNSEFAYSRSAYVSPSGLIWSGNFNLNHPKCMEDFLGFRLMDMPLASVIHTRECLSLYGFWDESMLFAADRDMWTRIIARGNRSNFSFCPVPTALKFRALWHSRSRHWWKRPRIDVYERLNLLEDILPPFLKVPIPDGMTEQEAVWQVMNRDPKGWAREFRKSVIQLLDARLYDIDDFFPLFLGKLGRRIKGSLNFIWRLRLYRKDQKRLLESRRK